MIKILMIVISLLLTSCDANSSYVYPSLASITGPSGDIPLELYTDLYKDSNGYYHYDFEGTNDNYHYVHFMTNPSQRIWWDSPDEFVVEHMGVDVWESIINYSTYANTDGIGKQLFYISSSAIGDTLTIIGFVEGVVSEEIQVIIN